MRAASRSDMFEELKAMGPGARLAEVDGTMVLLEPGEPGEPAGGGRCEEMFVKRYAGEIADARTGEIVWPVEDE